MESENVLEVKIKIIERKRMKKKNKKLMNQEDAYFLKKDIAKDISCNEFGNGVSNMTKGELLRYLDRLGKEYRKECLKSLNRNIHMNELEPRVNVCQSLIDAILVDFINYVGNQQGLDYGLHTRDWKKKEE